MMEVYPFNIKSLEQTCFEVLNSHLCPENCIELWQFTNAWNIPIIFKLKNNAFQFICENFEEVSLCEEFLQLTVQELADILGQDDLTVTQESTVYESVLRWINHMPEDRQGDIATLLPKVRLGLMDKSYIMYNVLDNDLVKRSPESHLLVFNTLQIMSQPLLLHSEPGINNTIFCRRLPNAVLLMFTFFSGSIEAFDFTTNCWITVHTDHSLEDSMTRFFYNIVFFDGYVYIVGGGLGWLGPFDRMRRFNLFTHTWQEMSRMQESRDYVSVTVLKGCIYALAGSRNDGTSLRTAERYQPDINQWKFIASMNENRTNASSTTLNNKIYICGGWNFNCSLKTAEYYNPDTNQWTLIAPMGTPRYGLGVVVYMGKIYAVGGRDSFTDLSSAEAYDPVTNTWHNVAEMSQNARCFGIGVMNKRIFVVSCTRKKNVECYDYTTNTWSVVFSEGDCYFDIVNCCVISGQHIMAEYCSPREPVIHETQC